MSIASRLQQTRQTLGRQGVELVARTRRAARAFGKETREATGHFARAVEGELGGLSADLRHRSEASLKKVAPVQLQLAFLEHVDTTVGRLREELRKRMDRLAAATALPAAPPTTAEVAITEHVALEAPLPGYESLSAKTIVAKLDRLEPETWEAIRAFEEAHKNRRTVLRAIDRRLAA